MTPNTGSQVPQIILQSTAKFIICGVLIKFKLLLWSMRGGFETSFPLDPIKSHITSRWIHEISQAQSSVLRNPPPADRSSPQHEHNAAPWFISCSIYPFKMNWINELSIKSMTLKHDGLLRLSSGNAETPFNEECIGLIGRQMRSEYKWCSVWSSSGHGYCVHEYFCLFFCFVFFD